MKVLSKNEALCIGCKKCMVECATTYYKDETGDKSVIKITENINCKFDINVCNQCGYCTTICPTQALTISKNGVITLNRKKCVECYACVGFCDTLSIHYFTGERKPSKCIACGKCAKVCPTNAIYIENLE